MENASKALIIAGAVLITIVLITLGVTLIQNSGDASGQAQDTANVLESQGNAMINNLQGVNFLN